LYRRQREARSVSMWTDGLGMGCGRWALTPEQGTVLRNRLQAETDRLHRAARSNGSTDTLAQHAADAFALLLNLPITHPASHTPSPADGSAPADSPSPTDDPSPTNRPSDSPPADSLVPPAGEPGVLFPAGLAARAAKLRPRTE